MTFGLQDTVVVDRAKLANRAVHRTDEIRGCDRTRPCFQRSGEEIVKGSVAANVLIRRLTHVHAIFVGESADEPRCNPAVLCSGDTTSDYGEPLLGQHVLQQDLQAFGHGNFHPVPSTSPHTFSSTSYALGAFLVAECCG